MIGRHRGASACSAAAWNFARVEEFWRELEPLTPYGKDYFEARHVHSSLAAIEADCGDIEAYGGFASRVRSASARLDKLAWHLRRIPRLPGFGAPGVMELFLFKKFLSNCRACADLLDDGARAHFGIEFASEELAELLAMGGADPESFHIASAYDEALGPLRAEMAGVAEEIAQRYSALADAVLDAFGFDFADREFLIVPADEGLAAAAAGAGRGLTVEPFDDQSYLVRRAPDAALLELERRREALREEEQALEAAAAARISASVDRSEAEFARYAEAVARLDVARCRFLLAEKYGLSRPSLGGAALRIEKGRFLPLAGDCASMGTAYTPVSVELRHSAAVLSGSNMGGKTVALQSILFLQILAQSGMYVPAELYESKLYDFIEYIGEGCGGGGSKGLSGFGREVRDLSEVLGKSAKGACLAAFDEFARTTGSEEAEALLSEVVGRFAEAKRCTALFATHFGRIERDRAVHWLRMAGLDRKAARERFQKAADAPGAAAGAEIVAVDEARLRDINRLMRYEILEDRAARGGSAPEDEAAASDALEIAALLGLDAGLIAGARRRLAKRRGGGGDES
ncbi:hypothetical protein LWX53_03210 [bacterium]|nr:hypothetical protein [bacterium]